MRRLEYAVTGGAGLLLAYGMADDVSLRFDDDGPKAVIEDVPFAPIVIALPLDGAAVYSEPCATDCQTGQ